MDRPLNSFFIVLLIFLVSCSLIPNSGNSSKKDTSVAKQTPSAAKTNNLTGIKTLKCEDSDGTDITVKGKTTLFYDDGTKQAYSDYCPGKNTVLNVFVQEYFCDGVNIKSKLFKCSGTCDDGICVALQNQTDLNQTNQTA